jgi:hypothetical protein
MSLWKIILLLLAVQFLSATTCAQQGTIEVRGAVQDSAGTTLELATVQLLKLPDSSQIAKAMGGLNGFVLKNLSAGKYLLICSHVGYQPDTIEVTLRQEEPTIQLPALRLFPVNKTLVEVIIEGEAVPVRLKNDTISYHAASFKTRPNASVEDLLKKLPGISIERNGSITLNGKKVEKIYIDGKEFSLISNTTITRNFTADMIDKVEGFKDKTDVEKVTGINRGGEEIAGLNLKLKKDKKNGFFGKTYLGGNVNNYYTVGANLNTFKGERMFTGIFNSNNSNNLFMGSEQKGRMNAAPGNQTITHLNLNYRNRFGEKLVTTGSYLGSLTDNTITSSSLRKTFLPDATLSETRKNNRSSNTDQHTISAQLDYTIDPLSSFQVQPRFSAMNSESHSLNTAVVVTETTDSSSGSNTAVTDQTMRNNSVSLGNTITYRKRSKMPGNFFSLAFGHGYYHSIQESRLLSLRNTQNINQQTAQSANGYNYNLQATYTHAIASGNIIDFGYSIHLNNDLLARHSYNFDSAAGTYSVVDTLTTSRYKNSNTIQKLEAGYSISGKEVTCLLGAGLQLSSRNSINYLNRTLDIEQRLLNWYPRASLTYNMGPGKSARISYGGSTLQPDIEQLQPIPGFSNPFLIRVGNPRLKQQFNHNVQVSLSSLNMKKSTNLMIGVIGNLYSQKIASFSTVISTGVQQLKYVNLDGAFAIGTMASYGFPIASQKKGSGKLGVGINYNHDKNFVNGKLNLTNAVMVSQKAGISYHRGEKLFIDLDAAITYNMVRYSINKTQNPNYVLQNYSLDVSWQVPADMTLNSNFDISINGKQNNLPGKTVPVLNASLSKLLLRNKQGELKLLVFDLLNRNNGFRNTSSENFVQTSEQQVLRRFFMLSFIYNIKSFGMKKR